MSTEKKQGLASMSLEKRREIASKGGKVGKGHKWTREEAQAAGRKSHRPKKEKEIS